MTNPIHQPFGEVGHERSACGQLGQLATAGTEHPAVTCPTCAHIVAHQTFEDALLDLVTAAASMGVGWATDPEAVVKLRADLAANPDGSLGDVMRPRAASLLETRRSLVHSVLGAALAIAGTEG
jgi:hypothetical protein